MSKSNSDLSKRIDDLEGHLSKEISDARNDLGSAIAKLDRRMAKLEKKIDSLGSLHNHLGVALLTLDVFAVGTFASTSTKEEIESVLEWWKTVDFNEAEIPDEVKPGLFERHEGYKTALETLSAS